MNLYLSSYMIGDHLDRLLAMAGGAGARMAVITNALDAIPLTDQLAYARHEFDPDEYFADLGFDPSLVDLRGYAGREQVLHSMLLRHRVIWVLGGNAFVLRRAMRESGFDRIIRSLVAANVVYAGWSAGACVAGDSLTAVGLMDDPAASAPGYLTSDAIDNGLALLPFTIIPHFQSAHVESGLAGQAVAWATQRNLPFRALRDGEVLVVEDGGPPTILPSADSCSGRYSDDHPGCSSA